MLLQNTNTVNTRFGVHRVLNLFRSKVIRNQECDIGIFGKGRKKSSCGRVFFLDPYEKRFKVYLGVGMKYITLGLQNASCSEKTPRYLSSGMCLILKSPAGRKSQDLSDEFGEKSG